MSGPAAWAVEGGRFDLVGRTVGTYELIGKIGEGGMGVVYKGFDRMVEREVAIKVLRPEIAGQPEILERFRAEAKALAKLNHTHIATLYSLIREEDEYFMVMEFVTGRTLESIIRESPPFPPKLAISIASQVLDAIDHASSNGILHRDIKPANIMLTPSAQVKVTDFGIARILGNARLTREGCAYGTLEYISPERIRGVEGDVRSDLYSVGVVLYEMLTGQLPFKRNSDYELMRAHLEEAPPAFATLGLTSISPMVEGVVQRALAKVCEDRFASASEFRSALAAITAEHFTTPHLQQVNGTANLESTSVTAAAAATTYPDPVGVGTAGSGKWRWAIYGLSALAVSAIVLMVVLSWNHARRGADAVPVPASAQAPPVTAQPQTHTVETPETKQSRQRRTELTKKPNAPSPSGQSAASDKAQTGRRQAALKALDQNGAAATAAKKATDKDLRSKSLDALQK